VETKLTVDILRQPNCNTCGATCLHAIYRYYGEELSLEQVIDEVSHLDDGGTLDVFLANHALRRGYHAKIFTYNLRIFDPTWFDPGAADMSERLRAQMLEKQIPKLSAATEGYLEFIERGGQLRFEELTPSLIRKYLNRGVPVLTGLSATYLYRSAREHGPSLEADDIRGFPTGHFVVLCGYDKEERQVLVADPLESNPVSGTNQYMVSIDRAICAILLGIVTYDANLLIIEPTKHGSHADSHRRQQQQ